MAIALNNYIVQRLSDGYYQTESSWSSDITQAKVYTNTIPYNIVYDLADGSYACIQVLTKTT